MSTELFFTRPPLEDRAGETPRLYLPPELVPDAADTLKLPLELSEGLLVAELVSSDNISSLTIPAH